MAALAGFLALGVIADGAFSFSEIANAGGYARQVINLQPAGGGKMVNDAEIAFPSISGAAWSPYNALAIFDALSAGNQLMAWRVNSPQPNDIRLRQRVRLGKGAIQLSFPVVLSNFGTEVILSGPFALSPQGLFTTPPQVILASKAEYDALPTKDARTVYIYPEA